LRYMVRVLVKFKAGVADPQGRTILAALHSLGYEGVRDVRAGKLFELVVEGTDEDAVRSRVEEMCGRLLANPVLEDYEVSVLRALAGEGR